MANEIQDKKQTDSILFSNVTVVRNQEGDLSLWVGNEKALGVVSINIGNGVLSMGMPLSRVRIAEDVPATPVREIKNNVFGLFGKFRASQNAPPDIPDDFAPDVVPDAPDAPDAVPTTDGDSQ